jgi:phospholipase/carboxylesterase
MRAWYDITGIDRRLQEDEAGIRGSYGIISDLIRRENERGIPTQRIVLGGFSQGGSMSVYAGTRYPETLAGIAALSCYMLLRDRFDAERVPANQQTPIFMAHGQQDPLIPYELGLETRQKLEAAGYQVRWQGYHMPHSVCPQEVSDIAAWLRGVLP